MVINKTYRRKTFTVQAIQVTNENMQGLAQWCGGNTIVYFPDVYHQSGDYRSGQSCVEVVIGRVNGRENKTRAFPGDWITKLVGSEKFRVYRDKTFLEAFEAVLTEFEKREAILDLVREAIDIQDPNAHAFEITEKIMNIYS